MAAHPPSPQWRRDEITIDAKNALIRSLEARLDNAVKKRYEALQYVKREIERLLDDPAITRRQLRKELRILIERAKVGCTT